MTKSLSTARSTSSSTALPAKGSEAASETFSAPSSDVSSPKKDLQKQQPQPQTYQWVKSVLSIKMSKYPHFWLRSSRQKDLKRPMKTVSSFRFPLTLTNWRVNNFCQSSSVSSACAMNQWVHWTLTRDRERCDIFILTDVFNYFLKCG